MSTQKWKNNFMGDQILPNSWEKSMFKEPSLILAIWQSYFLPFKNLIELKIIFITKRKI